MNQTTSEKPTGVPEQIFGKFLESLPLRGIDAEIVSRLSKALLEDKAHTDKALKAAIFPEERVL